MLKMRRLFVLLGLIASPVLVLAGGMPKSESSSNETNSSSESQQVSESTAASSSKTASETTSTETSSNDSSETSDSGQTSSNAFLAIEDEPLIIDVSGISDSDGVGKIYVQWQKEKSDGRWIDIFGATQQSFTPRQVHVGQI